MGDTGRNAPADDDRAVLEGQAELLAASQALGRSPALERLFAFLLECSREGRSPKEVEIADQVFARTAANAEGDASVRVYMHRLRRKLDEFYGGPGAGEPVRLTIPKGGYRLVLAPLAPAPASEPALPIARADRTRWLAWAGLASSLVLAALALWLWLRPADPDDAVLRPLRANPLWSGVVGNGHRVIIVVGDFYIFGDTDQNGDVTRLVREFDVNSASDLDRLKAFRPERAGNYVDLGLDYLPLGVATALRFVVPVVRRSDRELVKPQVVAASQLTPEMIKDANLVYVGYLSGLGSLRDPTFGGSRFTVGDSYDEIVDRATGRRYMAGTHLDAADARPTEDYALISSFAGVTGNRVVVIAGTRDAALMQAADFATRAETLARITAPLHDAPSFEALLGVESLGKAGLRARLLAAAPRRQEADWSGRQSQAFPDQLDVQRAGAPAH